MMRFKYLICTEAAAGTPPLEKPVTQTHTCHGTAQSTEQKPISARKPLFQEDLTSKCSERLSQSCLAQTFSDLTTSLTGDTPVAIVNALTDHSHCSCSGLRWPQSPPPPPHTCAHLWHSSGFLPASHLLEATANPNPSTFSPQLSEEATPSGGSFP